MADLDMFDRDRERARNARREAEALRKLFKISTCGLDMRIPNPGYGTYNVPSHIALRVSDMYPVWADEYDAIADDIERDLEARLTRSTEGTKP